MKKKVNRRRGAGEKSKIHHEDTKITKTGMLRAFGARNFYLRGLRVFVVKSFSLLPFSPPPRLLFPWSAFQ
jgi:hypothetical protein